MKQTLLLRLIVTEPPPGVWFAMQRGKSGLFPSTVSSDTLSHTLVFEFPVQVDLSKNPLSITGEFTQGPPAKRFVYVNSGTYAGQPETVWARRAKVPLTGISATLAREAIANNGKLLACVCGVGKDGGPFCASVPLLSGWVVESATE